MARERVQDRVESEFCTVDWARAQGLWTAADDLGVLERYGPHAWTDHWYCCGAAAEERRAVIAENRRRAGR